MTTTIESVDPSSSDTPPVSLELSHIYPVARPQEKTHSSSLQFPFVVQEQLPTEIPVISQEPTQSSSKDFSCDHILPSNPGLI